MAKNKDKKTKKKDKKTKVSIDEAMSMLCYLANHEKNVRVIDFLNDRDVDWKE